MGTKKIGKEYLFAVAAIIAWGTCAPVCKAATETLSEEFFLFMSSALAFVSLLILNILNRGKIKEKNYKPRDFTLMALFGFIGICLYMYFYYIGIARLPSAEACTINYLWPIMIVFFSIPILKEKLTLKKVVAILISFCGITLVATQGNFVSVAGIDFAGVFFCLAAVICYGFFCVLLKKYDYDEMLVFCIAYLITTIFSGIICIVNNSFSAITPDSYVGILWNGVIVNAAAYLLWAKALNSGETSKISNIAYLTPFLSLMFGKILLDENISVSSFIGLCFIVFGILIQLIKINRKTKKSDKRILKDSENPLPL